MNLVVDANILFAAIIKNGLTAHLFVDRRLQLHAPKYIFDELRKYETYIRKKTGRSDDDIEHAFNLFYRRINQENVVSENNDEFSLLDPNDVDYLQLAKQLHMYASSTQKSLQPC